MEKEKLNKLYDFVIDNDDLTTKDLNDLGFNYRNIRILIDNKKLERIRNVLIKHMKLILRIMRIHIIFLKIKLIKKTIWEPITV